MSDECEMFGQCMLESLLARPAATAKRNFRRGLAWVGILLIIAAVSPVIIGVAIFKEQGAVAIVADVDKTRDTHLLPEASMTTARLQRISLTK
jgi:hypothetical protein